MEIKQFKGTAANVNSYVLIGEQEVMVIDALRSPVEAENLATYVSTIGRPLRYVLVTHGHPDHFMGLNVLRSRFPHAEFIVSREGIKEDIIRYSLEMEKDGWLDGNPANYPFEGDPGMKGQCALNPRGFDYERELNVLRSNRMALNGLELQLSTLYQPTECTHMTTVYVPAMKALFAADLVYHKMFPWLGRGVEAAHVHNWMNVLRQLQENYRADAPTIYPGHGSPGRIELLEEQVGFLQNFMAVVESAPSEYEAVATLIRKYPDYYQREFILPSSVSNFMKEGTEPDRKSLANVYAMRNSGGEYRWSAPFRKVL